MRHTVGLPATVHETTTQRQRQRRPIENLTRLKSQPINTIQLVYSPHVDLVQLGESGWAEARAEPANIS
jgi:hypothetical protein